MSILINIASEFTGKKAFKQAEKATFDLDKSVKKLGKSLGLALSTTAIVAFGKAAAKALAEDQAAAARLSKTVDNLGLSFANPQITAFINTLSQTAAVADDELRPAMQALLTTTGSVTASQNLLSQAIDISRGSGIDLATVTQDLANAYVGNTKGLKKYNLGLTQAELKAASFTTIQEKLNAQFGGSNAAYLATYAGQMQALTVAAGEAKETIGQGLIDAFKIIAGDTTITDLSTKIQTLATNIADFFRGVAQGFKDLSQMPVIKQMLQLAEILLKILGATAGAVINPFVTEGRRLRAGEIAPSSANTHLQELQGAANAKAAAAAEKAAAARAKALLKAQKDNTKQLKQQAATKKQSALFDLEQIQIVAALKGKISKEEELRLRLQLALITGNTEEADSLSRQLANAIDSTGRLAQYLRTLPDANNPFKHWEEYLDNMISKARTAAVIAGATAAASAPTANVPVNASPFPDPSASQAEINRERGNLYGSGNVGAQTVVVQIDGKAVASALLDQSMSAGQVAYLDRRTGGFG